MWFVCNCFISKTEVLFFLICALDCDFWKRILSLNWCKLFHPYPFLRAVRRETQPSSDALIHMTFIFSEVKKQFRKRRWLSDLKLFWFLIFSTFIIFQTTHDRSIHERSERILPTILSIQDTCTKQFYFCSPNISDSCYIYFLAQPDSKVLPVEKSLTRHRNLTYFDYTYASVARLAELTTFPILILTTSALSLRRREMLERISANIRMKKVVPKYLNFNIKTTKIRHVHTFGKYEVFRPENTLGFQRIVFMVCF